MGYSDWSLGGQNQFHDMHTFDPSYMFNAPEVSNEYNLLNSFLSTSLLDDEALYSRTADQTFDPNAATLETFSVGYKDLSAPVVQTTSQGQQGASSQALPERESLNPRPASTKPNDKARETYYLTAADPSGSDPPEERMNKLLKAKYDAGLLKPFNYLKGYARLSQYMDQNMQPASRQKILRQLDKFRPTFRERMQKLTDIELVLVEMWFERSLMEYDRVFASMAIPACCWRRTGEIFRGNKEMAQLIHVPIDSLRDVRGFKLSLCAHALLTIGNSQGKIAIHEIFEEDSLVSYWEKFGTIAFDKSQKAMLTSCVLKNLDPNSTEPNHCCFSFTIRRDNHDMLVNLRS